MEAKSRVGKYRNQPVMVDGERFASKKEARRWVELKLLERSRFITELERQVRFDLKVNGMPVTRYVADFRYKEGGVLVVEDVKGCRSGEAYRLFLLKKALMQATLGIDVREV